MAFHSEILMHGWIFYLCSLGSTRFFKVAKVNCKEGPAVVKVFVIHDPSLPLRAYKEKLEGGMTCTFKIIKLFL